MNFKTVRRLTFHRKLQILWVIAHIALLSSLLFNFSLLSLAAAIMWTLIVNIGSEAGAHRLFAHRSYETTKLIRLVLLGLQTFAGEGSVLAFCGVHRQHHKHSDTAEDPHSPKNYNWITILFWLRPSTIDPRLIKDCLTDSAIRFQHDYYFAIHVAIFCAFIAFGQVGQYGYFIGLPTVLILYGNGLTNIAGHNSHKGYRNFNTADLSVNRSGLINQLLMGGGLQNNHHFSPSSPTTKVLPSESDSMGWIINSFLKRTTSSGG